MVSLDQDQDLQEVGAMGEVTGRTASREITGMEVRGEETMKIDMTKIIFLLYILFSQPWFTLFVPRTF